MKILIELTDQEYLECIDSFNTIRKLIPFPKSSWMLHLVPAVESGIILSDTDGRLIDADALERSIQCTYNQNLNSFSAISGIPDINKNSEHYARMAYLKTRLEQMDEDLHKIRQAKTIVKLDKE